MKKLIILKHGGGELANQLWNYASIYAYGLEMKIPVQNPSFFEYHSFFNFLPKESTATKFFSLFFRIPRRRHHVSNRIARWKYAVAAKFLTKINSRCVFSSENNENRATSLPPTSALPSRFEICEILYFTGWLFRNPLGLHKFRDELRVVFAPNQKIEDKLTSIIKPFRDSYKNILGIHIRQTDYKAFKGGKFLISQERIRSIIDEYIRENVLDKNKTLCIITSDGFINEAIFKGLNIHISKENAVTDLFLLSKTDAILGSHSTFGNFASWYGDIPRIIFKNEPINWQYYRDKKSFFENKYSTITQY